MIRRAERKERRARLHLGIAHLVQLGRAVDAPEVRAGNDARSAILARAAGRGDEAADHGCEQGLGWVGPDEVGELVLVWSVLFLSRSVLSVEADPGMMEQGRSGLHGAEAVAWHRGRDAAQP